MPLPLLSYRWAQQHEYLEKLNMQAVLSASANEDEFIKEFLISYGKVSRDFIAIHIYILCVYIQK